MNFKHAAHLRDVLRSGDSDSCAQAEELHQIAEREAAPCRVPKFDLSL